MKLEHLLRPGYRRALLARRVLAGALVAAAALHTMASRTADPLVLVFAQSAQAGRVLDAAQVEVRRMPARAVPDNALRTTEDAVGQILAAPASAGEVVTSTRVVGPDLTRELAGDAQAYSMVPVALAEPDIIPMLHHGARVNVVTVAESAQGAQPATIATGGHVVLAGAEEGTVMLLLPTEQASAVAAASLSNPLTVVLSG